MAANVKRRVVWLDMETTGLDPENDRIVEIALLEKPSGQLFHSLVNPSRSIPAEATAIHGITAAMVKDAPVFAEIAPMVQTTVSELDTDPAPPAIGSYNGRRYDVVMLDTELRRAGQPGFPRDVAGRIVAADLDLYAIWVQKEMRSLQAAIGRFTDKEGVTAHRAKDDVLPLPEVLEGMAKEFGFDPADLDALIALSIPEYAVDRAGKFRKDGKRIVFNFGKHRDEDVRSHLDYVQWMLEPGRDFPEETQAVARWILEHYKAT